MRNSEWGKGIPKLKSWEKRHKKIMVYRLMLLIVRMMSHIPLPVARFLGKMLGLAFAMAPMERLSMSLEHIEKSLGDSMTKTEIKRLNRKVIRHFAQMFFEVPHILRLDNGNLGDYVVFENEENFLGALKKGKGLLSLTGHLGNWELMSVAVAVHFGVGGAVVARPIDFEPLEHLMTVLRSRFGIAIIMKKRGMRRVLATIRANKVVGILLDQNVDWYDGVFVKFFGRWACTNKGLALLALKTDAPVVPIFSARQKDGRYRIMFGKEVELIRTGDKTKDVEENTALFTNIIERYVRAYPDQYFWFHRRWKTRPYWPLPAENEVMPDAGGSQPGGI